MNATPEVKLQEFHLPQKPYSVIDAINRYAAGQGSVSFAIASADANYNGHAIRMTWNTYRGYYICEHHWSGRVVHARGNAFIKVPVEGWLLVQELSIPEGKVSAGNFTPDGTTDYGQVIWPKFTKSMVVRGEHGGSTSPLGTLSWLAPDLMPNGTDEEVRKVKERVLHDNRRVKTTKYGGEFLAVSFAEPDQDWTPWSVALYRYCVPGRIDSYSFDYVNGRSRVGPRIRYFTDTGDTLVDSLAQVQIDLDKPQVIDMLVKACSQWKFRGWARDLTERLIADIAPKSKCLRALRRAIQTTKEEALKLAARTEQPIN